LIAFSSTFTTPAPPDLTAPTVTAVNPANGLSSVAVGTAVTVTFSEAMNATTITGSTFTLTPSGGSPVAASISYNAGNNTATLTPSSALAYSTTFAVSVTSGAKDLAGNGLVAFSSSFATGAAPADVTPPSIVSITPANRSNNAGANAAVRIQFSEPIDFSTVSSSSFVVKEYLTFPEVPGTRTYEAGTNTIVFTPSTSYVDNKGYNVIVTTGVKDLAGNALSSQFESCFNIAAGNGTPISMSGFWAGNISCLEVHFHLPMVEDGSGNLSLGPCVENFCTSYGVSPAGVQRLGGDSCPPSNINPGFVYCALDVVSLTGTHSGNNVSFTWTMANGLTFNFTGVFAESSHTTRKFLNGVTSGATMPAVGTSFEREGN
jgi:methionine-rich copper-binding protein CopC